VRTGDTLIALCNQYLEDPRRWREVAKANRLRNPDLIRPGQTLLVPVSLLKGIPIEGKIAFIKGDVKARADEGTEWRPLYLHDMLRQGAMIRTADESSVELAFEYGTSLSLTSNTLMAITDAREKGGLQNIRTFFLHAGRVATKVRGVTGRESRFEIHTPSAVAAARGTEFRTSVDPSEATRSEVLHGSIGVQAMKQSVELKEGEGTVVLKNKPPLQPKKLLRPPAVIDLKPLYKSVPLTVLFENVEGAVSCRVLLARDKDMKDILQEKLTRPHETVQIAGVEDGTYFLQSSSIDDLGLEGHPTEPIEVAVRINPLPPIMQSPQSGAEYREPAVNIMWLKVPDAKHYHLQIAEDREFRTMVEEQDNIQDLTYRTKDLGFRTYHFRMRSIADDGYEGAWSDVWSFSVVPPPPVPSVQRPLIDNKEMSFGWTDLGQGVAYHFQMSGDAGFNEILVDRRLDRPMITLQRPEHAGTYYVRTNSIDAKGHEGKFSEPQSFEIKEGFPYKVLGIMVTVGLIVLLVL